VSAIFRRKQSRCIAGAVDGGVGVAGVGGDDGVVVVGDTGAVASPSGADIVLVGVVDTLHVAIAREAVVPTSVVASVVAVLPGRAGAGDELAAAAGVDEAEVVVGGVGVRHSDGASSLLGLAVDDTRAAAVVEDAVVVVVAAAVG
jgi:hypothetical protein